MKIKVSEVAKEIAVTSKEVIKACTELGIKAKAANSSITPVEAQKIEEHIKNPKPAATKKSDETAEKEVKKETPQEEEKSEGRTKKTRKKSSQNSLSSMLRNRGKITFVRKGDSEDTKETNLPDSLKESSKQKKNFKSNSQETKNTSLTPKKEKKKKIAVTAQEKGQELDINVNLASMNSIEDDEVVLFDLSFNEIVLKEDEDSQNKNRNKKKTNTKRKRRYTISKDTKKQKRPQHTKEKKAEVVTIEAETRVYAFADKIKKPLQEVIDKLKEFDEELDKNDFITEEYIETIAEEFDIEVKIYNPIDEFDYVGKYNEIEEEEDKLKKRPPIVTIMGHVDHGKTSLLDKIRDSRVTSSEAGGITQHVGAYMVEKNDELITFIDTPGHEAFTEMRARGANVTDIVIIVVAADDGVMPQTKEAITHAQAAEVPIIIAINKMDKESANPERVTTQLSEFGIMPVDWGGEYEFSHVSAHTGEGIEELLETILLQAEVMELQVNPSRKAKAVVIESEIQKGRGAVATVISQNGTLRQGDSIVCGSSFGKVRTLLDGNSKRIKEVQPGQPAQVLGLNEAPLAGDVLISVTNDKEARNFAEGWKDYLTNKQRSKSTKATLEDLQQLMLEGNIKKLPVIVRADTKGSAEAIKNSLEKLQNEEVKVHVLQAEVGAITENDVVLANAGETPAIIYGFNVRPTNEAGNRAKSEGVEVRMYSIIYDLLDDVRDLLSGMLSPNFKEEITGTAEVREVFQIPKIGPIAGCMVTNGTIYKANYVRVIRDSVVIYDSKLSSLKRFKDDVKEVSKGYDCGIMVENYADVRAGDVIESYSKTEERAVFES